MGTVTNYYRFTVIYKGYSSKTIDGKYENDQDAIKVADLLLQLEDYAQDCWVSRYATMDTCGEFLLIHKSHVKSH